MKLQAIVFDKDGTLFGFDESWGAWAGQQITRLSNGDMALARRIGGGIGYDLDENRFHPNSPVIAGTVEEAVELMLPYLPDYTHAVLRQELDAAAAEIEMIAAVDLEACLGQLRAQGYALGVATNDSELSARAHLAAAGILDTFSFIAGYDSGYGAKPAPGQLLAFAQAVEARPEACAMVGDSLHDLRAARAAGMVAIGVLTGPATETELRDHADVVLPTIAELADWLERPSGL